MNKTINDYSPDNSSPQCALAEQCQYDNDTDDSFYSLSPTPGPNAVSDSCLSLSPILQIDGIVDITPPPPLSYIHPPDLNTSPVTHMPSVSTRKVQYALDRDK